MQLQTALCVFLVEEEKRWVLKALGMHWKHQGKKTEKSKDNIIQKKQTPPQIFWHAANYNHPINLCTDQLINIYCSWLIFPLVTKETEKHPQEVSLIHVHDRRFQYVLCKYVFCKYEMLSFLTDSIITSRIVGWALDIFWKTWELAFSNCLSEP